MAQFGPTPRKGQHDPEGTAEDDRIPGSRVPELYRARSLLYRSQILQEHVRWKALAGIYTMHPFAPLCTVLESSPKNQENHGEKRTWPKHRS